MGVLFSRWRAAPSTDDVLKHLKRETDTLELRQQSDIERQRQLIGSLILYSVIFYLVVSIAGYIYLLPDETSGRILCSLPLLLFPALIYVVRRVMRWYFVNRLKKNELALARLKLRKEEVIDDVIESLTYKKAKEILEKYAPERFQKIESPTSKTAAGEEPALSQQKGTAPAAVGRPSGSSGQKMEDEPGTSLVVSLPAAASDPGVSTPNLSMVRPILVEHRTIAVRIINFLINDGPSNRYALICSGCCAHNGMALREEFDYLAFRCCYCHYLNKARKSRPYAPALPYSGANPRASTQHIRLSEVVDQSSLLSSPLLRHRSPRPTLQAQAEDRPSLPASPQRAITMQ